VNPGASSRRAGQVAAAVSSAGIADDEVMGFAEPDVSTKPSETAAATTSGTAASNAQRTTAEGYAQARGGRRTT
jgi:hypothetical protein